MKTLMLRGGLLALVCVLSTPVWAITISLEPADQIAEPTDIVFLDLTVSGLGDGVAPSIGAYDIDLTFDDGALDFIGAFFGNALDDGDPFAVFIQSVTAGVGTINLAEVSLLAPAVLDAIQSDSIVLATLEFFVDVLPPGSSTVVDVGGFLLGDGFGVELVDVDTASAVIRNPVVTPEPTSLLLWGIGLLAIGLRVVRRR